MSMPPTYNMGVVYPGNMIWVYFIVFYLFASCHLFLCLFCFKAFKSSIMIESMSEYFPNSTDTNIIPIISWHLMITSIVYSVHQNQISAVIIFYLWLKKIRLSTTYKTKNDLNLRRTLWKIRFHKTHIYTHHDRITHTTMVFDQILH